MGADLAVVLWMQAVGPWLDRTSTVTAVATLGGHHTVIIALGGIGFAMLAGAAVSTAGFTAIGRGEGALVALACIVSVVALAGMVSFLVVVIVMRVVGILRL